MAKTLGFIMMLDDSYSMYLDLDMVKIDSKAFVMKARVGDQFGVNAFSDKAWWVYPQGSAPGISGVSADLHETMAAKDLIEQLQVINNTNIGEAVQLANNMISGAGTDLKAFVLLSDGRHNVGTNPSQILLSEPPIYIAGLGRVDKYYFDQLTQKNAKSHYYNSPTAYEMMLIFNQIKADSVNGNLALNDLETYQCGSDYLLKTFPVSSGQSDVQLSVVWSDKRYRYTPDMRFDNSINIVLYDPDDRRTDYRPDINEEGFCIYNLGAVKPGTWKVLFQYKIDRVIGGTTGSIDFNVSVHTEIHTPNVLSRDDSLSLSVSSLHNGEPVEGMRVRAKVDMPLVSVEDVMERYEQDLNSMEADENDSEDQDDMRKLEKLRQEKLRTTGNDILCRSSMMRELRFSKDGTYEFKDESMDAAVPGIYNFEIVVEGKNPETGLPYRDLKRHSMLVR